MKIGTVVMDVAGNYFTVLRDDSGRLTLRSVATKTVFNDVYVGDVLPVPGVKERG